MTGPTTPVRSRRGFSAVSGSGFLAHVKSISMAPAHTCALLTNGTMNCWGSNAYGQLGDGTTTIRNRPVVVKNALGNAALVNVAQMSIGGGSNGDHSCARLHQQDRRLLGQRLLGPARQRPAGRSPSPDSRQGREWQRCAHQRPRRVRGPDRHVRRHHRRGGEVLGLQSGRSVRQRHGTGTRCGRSAPSRRPRSSSFSDETRHSAGWAPVLRVDRCLARKSCEAPPRRQVRRGGVGWLASALGRPLSGAQMRVLRKPICELAENV